MTEEQILKRVFELSNSIKSETLDAVSEKYFYTIDFIESVSLQIEGGLSNASKNRMILDKLCKKLDVVKSVFTLYDCKLARKVSDEEVSSDSYKKIALILIVYSLRYNDLKFINTLLKMKNTRAEIRNSKNIEELIDAVYVVLERRFENS